jgi:cob(I)alamin adenosyltransferase
MSIITKTGDQGTTSLMYNRRVSKCDPRIEACGAVDELSAALGLARCASQQPHVAEAILAIQNDLIGLMGELATSAEDLARYERDGYQRVRPELTQRLERLAASLSAETGPFRGWALPGNNPGAAALDFARAVCRRAERSVVALSEQGLAQNIETLKYLNRLSDLLWLLARSAEAETAVKSQSQPPCSRGRRLSRTPGSAKGAP